MDGVITLVNRVYTADSIGQHVPVETYRDVFCRIESISRSEWVSAGQNSINASIVAVTPAVNYAGERIAVINGQRKAVYRTYIPPDSDDIELYLQDESGVTNGKNKD